MIADVIASLARLISGANVRWIDSAPDTRQCLYIANHTSHLDFVVVWSALPREVRARTRPVAARDYWEASKLRRYLAKSVFHAVLIDRGEVTRHNNPVDAMLDGLGMDHSSILFPKGTRGSGEEIGPFKSGVHHLVRE